MTKWIKHPVCGCTVMDWQLQKVGPCVMCCDNIEREYMKPPKHVKTWDDIRGERNVKLEATDWVDNNPARVSRSSPGEVARIRAYREKLFSITDDFDDPTKVIWPEL